MEDRTIEAQTLASLFRDQRRRIAAGRRGDVPPASQAAGTAVNIDTARHGFEATDARGTWTRWTDGLGRPEKGKGLPAGPDTPAPREARITPPRSHSAGSPA